MKFRSIFQFTLAMYLVGMFTGCMLVNKPKPAPTEPQQEEQPQEEQLVEPVQQEQPAQVELQQSTHPQEGENLADVVRRLQDTKIPALVDQKIEEIKKASAEGYRVYTETTTNSVRAGKMAEEFQKRGFKVKLYKLATGENYQLIITW